MEVADAGAFESTGLAAEQPGTTLVSEGEIPCVLVFPDRKHVNYIYNILEPIGALLRERGFKVYRLCEETKPDEHFGKTFDKIADECVLGVVVFDGLRPNVVYEYGLLRGKGKPVIPVQDKNACVAVKSFYGVPDGAEDAAVKSCTGLTKTQFSNLKHPPVGYFAHLSDRHGVNVIEVDCGAASIEPLHPKNRVAKELEKLMPQVLKGYARETLESVGPPGAELYEKFLEPLSEALERYTSPGEINPTELSAAIKEIERLKVGASTPLPAGVESLVASLHVRLARMGRHETVDEAFGHYADAARIYEALAQREKAPRAKAGFLTRLGDVRVRAAEYGDKKANCMAAISAYTEALRAELTPEDYAMTQNNLGTAYGTLAEVEDKAENCKLAVKTFKEALKVYTLDRFPTHYATTQNNLGAAYVTLAEVEDKAENCKQAVKAFKEAVRVYNQAQFPEVYPRVRGNLDRLLAFCRAEGVDVGADDP